MDDGSTDSTFDALTRLTRDTERARVLRHDSNRGRAASRNTGARAATGAVIACLDADARPSPRVPSRCTSMPSSHSGSVASMGRIVPADLVEGDPYSVYLEHHLRGPQVNAGPTSWAHFVTCAACIRS